MSRKKEPPGDVVFDEVAIGLLPAVPASVAAVRGRCRTALTGRFSDEVVDDVLLVASELATNALLHAATDIEFALSVTTHELLVQVADQNPHEPRLRTYGDGARTGRGLLLVER